MNLQTQRINSNEQYIFRWIFKHRGKINSNKRYISRRISTRSGKINSSKRYISQYISRWISTRSQRRRTRARSPPARCRPASSLPGRCCIIGVVLYHMKGVVLYHMAGVVDYTIWNLEIISKRQPASCDASVSRSVSFFFCDASSLGPGAPKSTKTRYLQI